MYQALYRKYRSQTFQELVGQEVVATTLKKAVASGKISHAYLFSGPRGTGKTSVAKIFAKAMNCPNQVKGEPCN
ncbi:AAA family ATPase, partial [Streptococcus sobrinus]